MNNLWALWSSLFGWFRQGWIQLLSRCFHVYIGIEIEKNMANRNNCSLKQTWYPFIQDSFCQHKSRIRNFDECKKEKLPHGYRRKDARIRQWRNWTRYATKMEVWFIQSNMCYIDLFPLWYINTLCFVLFFKLGQSSSHGLQIKY